MTTNPAVIAAVLASLDEGPRTEIIRVRATPKFKALYAKYSAAMGLPSATNVYNSMRSELRAHVRQELPGRTGASRRPVRPVMFRRQV